MANITGHDDKLMNESMGEVVDAVVDFRYIIKREVFMVIVKPINYVIHSRKVSHSLHGIDILDTWTSESIFKKIFPTLFVYFTPL